MAQKVFVDPIKYEVGTDIPEDQYREAISKIAVWFAQTRPKYKDPESAAKLLFQECLDGIIADGTPWWNMAMAPLASRVRSKCGFDLDTMKVRQKASPQQKAKKQRERDSAARKKLTGFEDPLIPDETKRAVKAGLTYGDDPLDEFTPMERRRWKEIRDAYTQEFPHLASINAAAELDLLCDQVVLAERARLKVVTKKDNNSLIEAGLAVKNLQETKKALGIHPEQLKNRVQQKLEMSIGAAAAKVAELKDFRKLRLRWFAAQALQYLQMCVTPSADGLEYQLNEIELFALTKCRTCHCAKCGHRNFVGLSYEEVEHHLEKEGVIVATGEIRSIPLPILEQRANADA